MSHLVGQVNGSDRQFVPTEFARRGVRSTWILCWLAAPAYKIERSLLAQRLSTNFMCIQELSTLSSNSSFRTTDSGIDADWLPQQDVQQHEDQHSTLGSRHSCLRCSTDSQVLQDSATSVPAVTADKLASTVQFLHRLDSANIQEIAGLLGGKCKSYVQTGRAVAALPPYEARQAFLEGPACPPCCPSRTETAEGINALRHVSSVDIGTHPVPHLLIINPDAADSKLDQA